MKEFSGRLLTQKQVEEKGLRDAVRLEATINVAGKASCRRCGSAFSKEARLPDGSFYCSACILMGRVCSNDDFFALPVEKIEGGDFLRWQGELTSYQSQVAAGMLTAYENKEACLVQAVTGAGKTEMLYPLLAKALSEGKTVCLASPRIDVCQELHVRLNRDFTCAIPLLYGEGDQEHMDRLTIATTHQLLKFYHAFDVLIIDEVDAFPYVDNPMLYHAVQQAVAENGVHFYLTATSTEALNKQVAAGTLKRLSLPRRFHGNPLVVPEGKWLPVIRDKVRKKRLPKKLLRDLSRQRKTGFPLLIFVAEIAFGQELQSIIQNSFPLEKVGFVSSVTEDRKEIVEAFRKGEWTILISTTILERGVTFPKVDVFVVEAHHILFTQSSLIQIAGRVGRSLERATGICRFYHEGQTKAIKGAIEEIKALNREAGFGEETSEE